uniref:Uncharacterized protein n=1 Tax=Arundo donax TaxID=35708 RepID=A0A0A9EJG8_ARUDO
MVTPFMHGCCVAFADLSAVTFSFWFIWFESSPVADPSAQEPTDRSSLFLSRVIGTSFSFRCFVCTVRSKVDMSEPKLSTVPLVLAEVQRGSIGRAARTL